MEEEELCAPSPFHERSATDDDYEIEIESHAEQVTVNEKGVACVEGVSQSENAADLFPYDPCLDLDALDPVLDLYLYRGPYLCLAHDRGPYPSLDADLWNWSLDLWAARFEGLIRLEQ